MCLSFNSIDLEKKNCLSKWTCISHLVSAYKKWWPRTNGVQNCNVVMILCGDLGVVFPSNCYYGDFFTNLKKRWTCGN